MTTAPPSPTLAANTLTANPRGRAGTLAQIGLLIQWQFRRLADMLVFMIIVQALLSATTIFGFGLLIGDPPPEVAAFLVTGAPTVTLITVGLVMAPQAVSQSKLEGSLGWMRTLPVPRWGFLAADLLMWTLIALPGTVLGILAGQWRFDAPLSLSPWLALAAPLVSLIAACIGYSMALLLKPQLAHLLTQVIVFIVLLFSPISFPADRLPSGVATIHSFLPFEPLADLMRATLMSQQFTMPTRSIIVLTAWTVLSMGGALAALRKRS